MQDPTIVMIDQLLRLGGLEIIRAGIWAVIFAIAYYAVERLLSRRQSIHERYD